MPMLTVATYNVNSIRARLERVLAWLGRAECDVVCLQELKVADDEFPREAFEAAGWHCAVHGQRTYNGVAILSRSPLTGVSAGLGDGVADPEARLLVAHAAGVRIVSAYVPNGQTVGSAKWAYKLAWMARLRAWLERRASPDEPLVLAGDFNVAPEDRDVARPDEWRDSVLCHGEARAALRAIVDWGLVDTVRLHHHGDGPYTWWDYRMLGFPKNNGLRIDHVLVTEPLGRRCRNAYVVRDERKGKQPSDHAPVVTELAGA
ncbi:MAG TPA: exodeoxyribonuclease III [Gemmatimonadales bacterium]